MRGKPVAEEIDLKVIAKRTPGFSGADLMNLVNEAAILAARESDKEIRLKHIEEAIDKVAIGPEKRSKIIKPKDQLNTAIHEIGHTLVSIFKESNNEFHKVTGCSNFIKSISPRYMDLCSEVFLISDKKLTGLAVKLFKPSEM